MSKYLAIGARRVGFFSNFLHTIDRIIECDIKNLVPVINWEKENFLYADRTSSETNCWNYYFEKINDYTVDSIPDYEYTRAFSMPPIVEYCFKDIPHHQHIVDIATFDTKREYVHKYVSEIVIKEHIQNKINEFVNKNFKGKKVLGIHVRGTDKWEETLTQTYDYSKFENYDELIQKEIGNYDKLFICTDSKQALNYFKKRYGNVVYYNAYRVLSHLGKGIHFIRGNYSTGEDVLIESVLLSKCDKLIITDSNVAVAALYFNPKVPYIYTSYDDLCIKK